MRILFYAPLKPLDHPHPSGDLVIGRSLFHFLEQEGHDLRIPSRLRTRWIFWKPGQLFQAELEKQRLIAQLKQNPVDLWLTYHCYYKAPDILGPEVCRQCNLPYVIIQGSYATKYQRSLKTLPGFYLNRRALQAADLHITTRNRDRRNLERLIPSEKRTGIRPGIKPEEFTFSAQARQNLRAQWLESGQEEQENRPIILTAAMFRPGVKTRGIATVLETAARLRESGHDFLLVVVGDGQERNSLQECADRLLPGQVVFTGRVAREEMYQYYSAADMFMFPGFEESLGMVYLEAQSCGLPVLAFHNEGIAEVVQHGQTGFLLPVEDPGSLDKAASFLLRSPEQRQRIGRQAAHHVREHHDLNKNYQALTQALHALLHH